MELDAETAFVSPLKKAFLGREKLQSGRVAAGAPVPSAVSALRHSLAPSWSHQEEQQDSRARQAHQAHQAEPGNGPREQQQTPVSSFAADRPPTADGTRSAFAWRRFKPEYGASPVALALNVGG